MGGVALDQHARPSPAAVRPSRRRAGLDPPVPKPRTDDAFFTPLEGRNCTRKPSFIPGWFTSLGATQRKISGAALTHATEMVCTVRKYSPATGQAGSDRPSRSAVSAPAAVLDVGWIKPEFLLRTHRCCAQPALLPPLSPTISHRGMMEADAPTGRCSSNRVLRPNPLARRPPTRTRAEDFKTVIGAPGSAWDGHDDRSVIGRRSSSVAITQDSGGELHNDLGSTV